MTDYKERVIKLFYNNTENYCFAEIYGINNK